MGRFVSRPRWLNEEFEICSLYIIEEIDRAFLGLNKPKALTTKHYDLEVEVSAKKNLSKLGQLDVHSIHVEEIWSLTDDAFFFFLPSITRLCLEIDDFISSTPAEDGAFDHVVNMKCMLTFSAMSALQQGATKCLMSLLISKENSSIITECDIAKWKNIPEGEFWKLIDPDVLLKSWNI